LVIKSTKTRNQKDRRGKKKKEEETTAGIKLVGTAIPTGLRLLQAGWT